MDPQTLPFDTFWSWLLGHPNCIVRAGTPETVLYDDDDLHWLFDDQEADRLLVQLVRGKRLVGEVFLEPEIVTYVEATSGDSDGEYVFELISETETERVASYFFVLSHGYEEGSPPDHGRVH